MEIEKITIDGCIYEYLTVSQALEIGATQAEIDDVLKLQNPEPTEEEIRISAKNAVDKAAGKARLAVAGTQGDLIDVEYQLTESQARLWDVAGRPSNKVPESVSSWALAAGKTNDEACTDILSKSEQWTAAIMKIRRARLDAASKISKCPIADVNGVVSSFVANLNGLK